MTKRMAGTQLLLDIIGVTSNPEMGGGHQGGYAIFWGGRGEPVVFIIGFLIP